VTRMKGNWLKSTSHLDLVGSFRPSMREADDDCLRDARVAVDTLTAFKESGDLCVPLARGVVAKEQISLLSDLAAGTAAQTWAAPRPNRTVFKSVGVAHADLAVAEYLFERDSLSLLKKSIPHH
jgi:ornithine cyclodeaminase/alanine dehydrogenase-like protein (mu-crystallin family)